MRVIFFFLTSHPLTTMSQFQSRLDKFHAMTNAGSLLHLNARHSFRQATEQLNGLARLVPDDKDKLAEDQEIWVEAEWMGRMAMRLVSQASAMEVEEVEQAVAPAIETRGGWSSEAVSVASSTCKVSSDAIGLSNRANGLPEGSGTGQGGRGGQVRHHQVEGLNAGGMAGQH